MEEDNLSFRAGITTLQDLSENVIASQLWKLPDMKRQVESFLDEYHPRWRGNTYYGQDDTYLHKLSPEISEIVKQELNHSYLPRKVKILIENKVLEMLEPAFNWIMYLIHDLNIDCKYVGKIYWTSNGTIDVDKIFQFLWMNFSEANPFGAEYLDENVKPFCYFVQEGFIINFKTNIANEIKSKLPLALEDNCDIVFMIMKSVVTYYDTFPKRRSWTDNCNIISKPAVEMLEICMSLCLYKAFVYFWNHLDEIEIFNYLEKQSRARLKEGETVLYGSEYLFQIAVFLMNEMNASQRDNFILCNFQFILLMSLKKKPFRMLCMPLLNKYLSRLERADRINLLVSVSKFRSCPQTNENLHLEILQFLMERNSMDDKEEAFLGEDQAWYDILNVFQIRVLKLIFNDMHLRPCRPEMIDLVIMKFRPLLEENNFKLLKTFMDEISMSESEELYLMQFAEREVRNWLRAWFGVCDGLDVLLDNVLDFVRTLNPERKLNIIISCIDWTHYTSLGLNKLIKWYFDTQEEPLIKNCVTESLVKHLCHKLIYSLWFSYSGFGGKNPTVEISTEILISVFGSDEEILNFKRDELTKNCVKFLCEEKNTGYSLHELETFFSVVDEFLNFCSLPAEKIEDIKKLIADQIDQFENWSPFAGFDLWS